MKKKLAIFMAAFMLVSAALPAHAADKKNKNDKDAAKLKIEDYVTKLDNQISKSEKTKDSQDFMWKALKAMPLKESTVKFKVSEEFTKDNGFVINDEEIGKYFFSLKGDTNKRKIHYVILTDGTILPADPKLSYDERPAFSMKDDPSDEKVDYVIYVEKDDPTLWLHDVNISLKRYKVKTTKRWEYEKDGFPLSKQLHSDAYDDDKSAKDSDTKTSGPRRAK